MSVFVSSLLLFGCSPNVFFFRFSVKSVVTICPMSFHSVSKDLKARIAVLFHRQGFKVKEICILLGLSKSMVYRSLAYAHTYGVPYNPHTRLHCNLPGRKHLLSQGDLKFIIALLKHRRSIYLDEIQDHLSQERGVSISIPTLLRTLRRQHYSHKGVSARALERDDILRAAFMNRIADEVTDPNMLMFVDEAARNKKTSARSTGWSLVGERCIQRRCFGRGQRFSILPILTLDGVITYDIIPGSVTSERFLRFLRELVVRVFIYVSGIETLLMHCRFPSPILIRVLGVSLFWTTAISIILKKYAHLSKTTLVCTYQSHADTSLMFLLDCKLIFLPPYSPDLNPIEQAFSSIKSYLRRFNNDYSFTIIDRACQNVSSESAWGFFCASGYVV